MTMKTKLVWISSILISVLFSKDLRGQEIPPKKPVYYFSITEAGVDIHSVYDKNLNIEYHDIYGKWKGILLQIYDQKQKMAGQYQLDKAFGKNHYQLKVEELAEAEVYKGAVSDESGREHMFYFKVEPLVKRKGPALNIVSLPINFSCKPGSPKIIDYYGEISGGIPPYEVNWYVTNKEKTDLLYKPVQSIIKEGITSLVTVDSSPPYYVVFHVKDFCGGESEKTLQVECDEREKQIHTLFIEAPVNKVPVNTINKR